MKYSKRIIALLLVCVTALAAFAGCSNNTFETKATESTTAESTTAESKTDGIDYMALVNKTHALPDDWEKKLETIHMKNSIKDDVEVEKKRTTLTSDSKRIWKKRTSSLTSTPLAEALPSSRELWMNLPRNTARTTRLKPSQGRLLGAPHRTCAGFVPHYRRQGRYRERGYD